MYLPSTDFTYTYWFEYESLTSSTLNSLLATSIGIITVTVHSNKLKRPEMELSSDRKVSVAVLADGATAAASHIADIVAAIAKRGSRGDLTAV